MVIDRFRFILTRAGAVPAVLAMVCIVAVPAHAQFGGLGLPSIPTSSSSSSSSGSDGCPKGKSKSAGSSVLGGFLGKAVGRAASSAGVSSWVPTAEVADTLTNAIACKLDPDEQKQAANATLEATRGEADVGSSSSWTSETRENVSGTSTVVARNDDATSGAQCIMVSDVVIVNGEETRANKRMCKPPGGARYSLVA